MELSIAEKFLLLIINPVKPKYLVSSEIRNAAIGGSILMDLLLEKTIEIADKKVAAKSYETNMSEAHRFALGKINDAKKPKKIKTWISKLSYSKKYRNSILWDLEKRGYIRVEDKEFLFFSYKKPRLVNKKAREDLINELRSKVLSREEIDGETSSILGLIQACSMRKLLSEDKEEQKAIKLALKEIMKGDSISKGVDTAIQEMQAAVLGAVVGAVVAGSSSN